MVIAYSLYVLTRRARALYKASAPGSLMLFGEHAVLHHKKAIVLAIDRRIEVILRPRFDKTLIIQSSLGDFEDSIDHVSLQKPFDFVIGSILRFKPLLKQGFELAIKSDFSDTIGFGSSAAVSVAVLAALYQWLGPVRPSSPGSLEDGLFFEALQVIRAVQGFGSGADVAASVFGGALLYQSLDPYLLKKFTRLLPITVVYSGFKTPTKMVVAKVDALSRRYPKVIPALYQTIDEIVQAASLAFDKGDWKHLGQLMNMQDGCMMALGVSHPSLEAIGAYLRKQPGIDGAKISGAGLGDCVIALGHCAGSDLQTLQGLPMEVSMGSQGVCYG